MADMLTVGARSLQAIQQALNTTGHNISNANTEGYSRQDIHFSAVEAQRFGFGYLGQGATVETVQRSYDSFLTSQVRDFTSSQSRYQIFSELSSRVDDIMANSSSSLSSSLQKFFTSIQDVANSPSTLPERQAMLGEAGNLVSRQQSFSNLLKDLNTEVNSTLGSTVTEINGLADSIAVLNNEIVSAQLSANGASPNDLLDQRDRLVKQLSEKVNVNTVEQSDGALSIFVGNGQSLVVGGDSNHLQTQYNAYDSSKLEIGIEGQVNTSSISSFLNGGELQGLIEFRQRVLDPMQSQLGLIMLGVSETVNNQHQLGMDLNNAMGGVFFQTGTIPVRAHIGNTGTAAPVTTLTDVSQLRSGDYRVNYDGAQWQLTRLSDNTSVAGAGPLLLDGLSVDVSAGIPVAGDSFLINPAKDAADTIRLAINDPRKIAAASPVSLSISTGNLGTATISDLQIETPNTLPLAGPITVTFNPDALGAGLPGFDVVGGPGGTIAYDPAVESAGKSFTFAVEGVTFTISDIPQTGDSFVIGNNAGAFGDNSNIQKIGDLQHQRVLNGSEDTYQEFYGSMVAEVGVINQQAQSNLAVETSLLEQASRYKDNASGVNLDEEATNMIKYQQQYQAAAQLIKVADQMFQSLLNSI